VCGRQTADALDLPIAPITAAWTMSAAIVAGLPDRLRAQQAVFDRTGGLHAAGLFTADGTLLEIAEDVGRHNAVDKVVGARQLGTASYDEDVLLCVSGRIGFDIVTKAVAGRVGTIVAVGGPSSLALDLADRAGVTVCGFTRGERFVVYTHPERITDI
jgi:FdhD protein